MGDEVRNVVNRDKSAVKDESTSTMHVTFLNPVDIDGSVAAIHVMIEAAEAGAKAQKSSDDSSSGSEASSE
jgi:hypothetical protein